MPLLFPRTSLGQIREERVDIPGRLDLMVRNELTAEALPTAFDRSSDALHRCRKRRKS